MHRISAKFLATAFFVSVVMAGCVKEELTITDPSANIQPVFGVPLVHADISAQRVIDRFDPNGEVLVEVDEVLSLVYRDTLEIIRASDYLTFPDQSLSETYTLTPVDLSELAQDGQVTIEGMEIASLDLGGDRLDSVRFGTGHFGLEVTADGQSPISGQFSLVDPITDEPLVVFEWNNQTGPVYLDSQTALDDRLFRLINDGNHTNGLKFTYTLTLENSGVTPQNIDFNAEFTDASIIGAGGYIMPRTVQIETFSSHVSIFDSEFHGTLRFEDPRINLSIDNGFGLSVQPVPHRLEGVNIHDESLVVSGENIEPLPVIAAAAAPGMVQETVVTITNASMTPTVTDFMAFEPKFVYGDLAMRINPDDDANSFVDSSSAVEVRFGVEIPLYGSVADYWLIDTTAVDLTDLVETAEDYEEIEEIQFRMHVENALPVDAGVQLVFLDSLSQPVDSLFEDIRTVVPSAPVDLTGNPGSPDYGRVIGTTTTTVDVPISNDRAQSLRSATQVVVKIEGHTTSNGDHPIRVYPEDHIHVHLAAKAKFNID